MDPVSVVFEYFKFLKFSRKNRENPQIRKQNSGWTVMLSQKNYYNKFGTYPKNLVLIALGWERSYIRQQKPFLEH